MPLVGRHIRAQLPSINNYLIRYNEVTINFLIFVNCRIGEKCFQIKGTFAEERNNLGVWIYQSLGSEELELIGYFVDEVIGGHRIVKAGHAHVQSDTGSFLFRF